MLTFIALTLTLTFSVFLVLLLVDKSKWILYLSFINSIVFCSIIYTWRTETTDGTLFLLLLIFVLLLAIELIMILLFYFF